MTTAEFIKYLKQLDPTGKADVFVLFEEDKLYREVQGAALKLTQDWDFKPTVVIEAGSA